jgi:hypothetical protein
VPVTANAIVVSSEVTMIRFMRCTKATRRQARANIL